MNLKELNKGYGDQRFEQGDQRPEVFSVIFDEKEKILRYIRKSILGKFSEVAGKESVDLIHLAQYTARSGDLMSFERGTSSTIYPIDCTYLICFTKTDDLKKALEELKHEKTENLTKFLETFKL